MQNAFDMSSVKFYTANLKKEMSSWSCFFLKVLSSQFCNRASNLCSFWVALLSFLILYISLLKNMFIIVSLYASKNDFGTIPSKKTSFSFLMHVHTFSQFHCFPSVNFMVSFDSIRGSFIRAESFMFNQVFPRFHKFNISGYSIIVRFFLFSYISVGKFFGSFRFISFALSKHQIHDN